MAKLAKLFTFLFVFTIGLPVAATSLECAAGAVSAAQVHLGSQVDAARAPFPLSPGAAVFDLGTGSQATVYRVQISAEGPFEIKKHYSSLDIMEDDHTRMKMLAANAVNGGFLIAAVLSVRGQVMTMADTRGRGLDKVLNDFLVTEDVKALLRAKYVAQLDATSAPFGSFSDETDPATGLAQRLFSRDGIRVNVKPENVIVSPDFSLTIVDPI